MNTVIWWIRRDLRIQNNPSLQAAINTGLPVIPLFILDPHLLQNPAPARHNFLFAALMHLDENIQIFKNHLVIREGNPTEVIPEMVLAYNVQAIFAEEDYSPYAIQRDAQIQKELPLYLIVGNVIHHPELVLKSDSSPYRVFTPFRKAWQAIPKSTFQPMRITSIYSPVEMISSLPIPLSKADPSFPATEQEAHKRLNQFTQDPIFHYQQTRDRIDLDGTSTLSPYLRFGLLSISEAFHSAQTALQLASTQTEQQGVQTWIMELIWREFYLHTLYHFPFVLKTAFQPKRRAILWRKSLKDLEAWKNGQTGYPIIDACMRQLNDLGWMHNRGRMIVASFLVKDLLINWQEGEAWFMHRLVDGDPAANNGGWQWSAGVGLDAAPYFRIFNPVLQSKKFDPGGDFIRRWLPELSGVPQNFIHEPWLMPVEVQSRVNCILERDYPLPIVDHQLAKKRVIAAFKQ
ncbi:MAG: deoxyribodipyrimidine photolyase [Chloroflexi bacterium 44-23]|nr:MAG: deoxyribodipyrimidine photolyase [Chloroflexi bacterium 44-23]